MEKWYGAAAICLNADNSLLMIKQGTLEEEKLWSIPSGGREPGETNEECCIREVKEETGYDASILRPLFFKKTIQDDYIVEVEYFEVRICGGEANIQDPDGLVYEIDWKKADDITNLGLTYPDERNLLTDFVKGASHLNWGTHTIITKRCVLAPIQSDNLEEVVNLYSNVRVRQYLGGACEVDDIKITFRKMLETNEDDWNWVIRSKQTNEFIGLVNVAMHHSNEDYEISYQLLPKWWGKGLATEATSEIITFCFTHLKLPRLVAETQIANKASRKLLERLGMEQVDQFTRFDSAQALYMIESR
ncbi:8-oxo-dGTP diphosphatase [Lentibacillus sp. JNUCC-1]|uniref:GNAT family N-acetyltransferase n=1 Tax=Lentibacillus sp. JNUCC-1 TaxID=2654513 RepID=UPI0012E893D3|nr:8-oxo-dGTP diphosphatase [Lentibacillus sp. JNUCC-1]